MPLGHLNEPNQLRTKPIMILNLPSTTDKGGHVGKAQTTDQASKYLAARLWINPRTRHARYWGDIPKGARYMVGSPLHHECFESLADAIRYQAFEPLATIIQVRPLWSAPTRGRFEPIGWFSPGSSLDLAFYVGGDE